MRPGTSRATVIGLLMCCTMTTSCGSVTTQRSAGHASGLAEGCATAEAPIDELKDFIPYEDSRGMRDDPIAVEPADADSLAAEGLPEALDRLPAEGMASQGRHLGAVYYTANGDLNGLMPAEFFKAGGVELSYSPVGDEPPVVDSVDELVPGQFIDVQVADYKGKLGWGDPDELGNRPHNLIWTADGVNFRVTAVREPQDIINITRAFLCK